MDSPGPARRLPSLGFGGAAAWNSRNVAVTSRSPDSFRHRALVYSGEDEFVARSAAFVREGLAGDEPTLVVVSAEKIARLSEELGTDGEAVGFADMGGLGNPAL